MRVAVVDVDHHHGNGTADILRTEHDIPFVSLHAGTLAAFPYIATQPHAAHQHFVPFDAPPSEEAIWQRLSEKQKLRAYRTHPTSGLKVLCGLQLARSLSVGFGNYIGYGLLLMKEVLLMN